MADNTRHPSRRPWHWLMPSLTQWLWLVLLLTLLAQPWRTMMVASDGDACMHWRVGEWMLEHKQIIRADVFSHTRFGQPIISKEWLAEIIFAAAGRLGGLYGLSVVAALVIATAFALLHRLLVREGNDILVATLVVLLAVWAASTHWLARPHVFSFLMVLLWNDALRRFEHDGRALRLAVVLGVLTLFWVNLHGAFLAGFALLGAHWLGAVIEWRLASGPNAKSSVAHKIKVLTAVSVFCGAASLLNPNGYQLDLHNLQFLRSQFLTDWLAEYSSTNFQSPGARGFLAWLALLFFTLVLRRPRVSAASALVLISWTYFALYAARNIPLMAILTAPIIAPALSETVRGALWEISKRVRQRDEAGRGWPVVAVAALAAIMLVPRPTELSAKDWPAAAVDYVRGQPSLFVGNMFNQYVWGGYLLQVLPEHKVFVDGRTDFYGESLIHEFQDTAALSTNWTQALDKYHVSWTLMPAEHRFNQALALSPGWQELYSDAVARIFCRASAPLAAASTERQAARLPYNSNIQQ